MHEPAYDQTRTGQSAPTNVLAAPRGFAPTRPTAELPQAEELTEALSSLDATMALLRRLNWAALTTLRARDEAFRKATDKILPKLGRRPASRLLAFYLLQIKRIQRLSLPAQLSTLAEVSRETGWPRRTWTAFGRILDVNNWIEPFTVGRREGRAENGQLAFDTLRKAIIQGSWMSGDRYSIAASLILDRTIGVVILTDGPPAGKEHKRATDLREFYLASGVAADRVTIHFVADAESAWKSFKFWTNAPKKKADSVRPKWLDEAVKPGPNVSYYWASEGTRFVTGELSKGSREPNPEKAELVRKKLRTAWTFSAMPGRTALLASLLLAWGFQPGKKYVLLWCKTGGRNDMKAHHFTSLATWRRLAAESEAAGVTPVAVGEDIGLRTFPSLVRFWDRDDWKWAFGDVQARIAQLALFDQLLALCPELKSVGMISGALEGPALLGVPTLYIEEETSERLNRFEDWEKHLPGFKQFRIAAPPGIAQQKYWPRSVKDKDQRSARAAKFDRLAQLVTSAPAELLRRHAPRSSSATYPTGQPPGRRFPLPASPDQRSISDRDRLIRQIGELKFRPDDFQLTDEEFKGILAWITGPPAQQPAARKETREETRDAPASSPPVEQVLPADWPQYLNDAKVVDQESALRFLESVAGLLGLPVDADAKKGLDNVLAKAKSDSSQLYIPVVGYVKGWVNRARAAAAVKTNITQHLNALLKSGKK